MTHSLSFYTYEFPDADLKYRDNFADMVTQHTRLIGMDGALDEYGDAPAKSASGSVQINFGLNWEDACRRYVQAGNSVGSPMPTKNQIHDAMQWEINRIKGMADWGRRKLFKTVNNWTAFCWAKVSAVPDFKDIAEKGGLFQDLQVSFSVTDPFWYQQGTEGWLWGDGTLWGGKPWGGEAVSEELTGQTTLLPQTIGGNTRTLPRITLYCTSGQTLTNPTIQRFNSVGAKVDEVKFIGTLVAGDSLEIDCRAASVRMNNSNVFTAATLTYLNTDWFQLEPGANDIRVLLENTTDEGWVKFRYYEVYR